MASEVVIGHDGIVDHFLGDAVMAFFNVPIKHEDHIARAIAAALEIQMALPRLDARLAGAEGLRVGVGIHTGLAFVGTLGSTSPKDYTAVGDAVNIAARLQGQAAPGEVLVTDTAYEAVRAAFPHAQRQVYEVKGIPDPIVAYVLT